MLDIKLHMMSRFQGAVRLLVIFVGLHRCWALAVLAFVKKKSSSYWICDALDFCTLTKSVARRIRELTFHIRRLRASGR